MFRPEDLISRYSRADAIADGVLIDVTKTAREVGFKFPVALTRTVWASCVAVSPGIACQDEAGRLWDVLFMLRLAIARCRGRAAVGFAVHVRNDNSEGVPPLVQLKAVCHPGDCWEPVITVMEPDED